MHSILFTLILLLCSALLSCEEGSFLEEKPLKVHFLDVGQGLSVLFEYEGRFALWDTGPDSIGFVDTLKHYGVDSLDWVVLSHWHRDHVGGFLEFPSAIKNHELFVKKVFFTNDTAYGFVSDSVFSILDEFGLNNDTIYREDSLIFASGWRFQILWPPKGVNLAGNASSGVLFIRDSLSKMLLMSDLETPQEDALLSLSPSLKTDLLQVGHHGSLNSNSMRFLSQILPSEAIISVGEGNSYHHPAQGTLSKLYLIVGDSSYVHRTDLEGSLIWLWHKNIGFWIP